MVIQVKEAAMQATGNMEVELETRCSLFDPCLIEWGRMKHVILNLNYKLTGKIMLKYNIFYLA